MRVAPDLIRPHAAHRQQILTHVMLNYSSEPVLWIRNFLSDPELDLNLIINHPKSEQFDNHDIKIRSHGEVPLRVCF
jgi:hypothetical protein